MAPAGSWGGYRRQACAAPAQGPARTETQPTVLCCPSAGTSHTTQPSACCVVLFLGSPTDSRSRLQSAHHDRLPGVPVHALSLGGYLVPPMLHPSLHITAFMERPLNAPWIKNRHVPALMDLPILGDTDLWESRCVPSHLQMPWGTEEDPGSLQTGLDT